MAMVLLLTMVPMNAFASESDVVPDQAFRAEINKILIRDESTPISKQDMEGLTTLSINSEDIVSMEGIKYAVNLTELTFNARHVKDISEISALTKLEKLSLWSASNIVTIEPLSSLVKLKELTMAGTYCVHDISPLKNLTNLEDLNLRSNDIWDLKPLSGLNKLKKLALVNNDIYDVSPLATLTNLEEVYLGSNYIEDLKPLFELSNLKVLDVEYARVTSEGIAGIEALTSLQKLVLEGNLLTDFTNLENLPASLNINLRVNRIADLSQIPHQTWVDSVRGQKYYFDISEGKIPNTLVNTDGTKITFVGDDKISADEDFITIKNFDQMQDWEKKSHNISVNNIHSINVIKVPAGKKSVSVKVEGLLGFTDQLKPGEEKSANSYFANESRVLERWEVVEGTTLQLVDGTNLTTERIYFLVPENDIRLRPHFRTVDPANKLPYNEFDFAPEDITVGGEIKLNFLGRGRYGEESFLFTYEGINGTTYGKTVIPPKAIGEYAVTAKLFSGAHEAEVTKNFSILPAAGEEKQEPDATAPTTLNAKFGQLLSAIEIKGESGTTAGKWTWKNPSDKVGNVGTQSHEAVFTPTNTTLYKTKEATINVEVAKADEPKIANVTKNHKKGTTGTQTVSVTELLPSDMEVTDVTLGAPTGDDIFATNPAYANGEITYTIKSGAAVGATDKVTVVVESSTHENASFDLNVNIIDKDPIEVEIGKTNFVYSGNVIPATEVIATAASNGKAVAGTPAWVSGKEPGTDAGEHNVEIVFTPDNTENYATANKSFKITIAPAKITGEPKISTVNEAGKKLSDITLEVNTLTQVGGTLEWKLPLDTVIEANTVYEWTYTVAGGNYEVKKGSFTPYVVAPPSSGGSSSGGGGGGSYSSVRPDSGSSTSTQTPAQPTQPTSTTTTTAPTGQPKAVLAIGQSAYQTTEGTKSSDVAPRIMEGRTFLPAKVIADVLGIQTSFDNATKTTTFSIEIDGVKNTVSVTRGKNVMLVNGVEVPLSTNSMIVDGRTMLPIRDIQTAFNSLGLKSTLVWDGATKQISLY